MSESQPRAPQLLFDDGSRAIQQSLPLQTAAGAVDATIAASSARGSIPILEYYELDRIASRIAHIVKQPDICDKKSACGDPWIARVALQFPDELLCDAPQVCWEMEDVLQRKLLETQTLEDQQQQQQQCPLLIFCLGDTTFGPCCADEVAALHLKADVLVHYGHACLSHPALSLPVVYGFGVTPYWDTETALDAILSQVKSEETATRRLLLLYQVKYQHAMEALQTQLSERGDLLVVAGEVPQQQLELSYDSHQDNATASNECCQGKTNCAVNIDTNNNTTQEVSDTATPSSPSNLTNRNTLLLGGLEVPNDIDFSSFTVVFIGDDFEKQLQPQQQATERTNHGEGQRQYMNTILWYLSRKSGKQPAGLWTYSPIYKTLQTSIPLGIQRQLNRRFYLIQKARDAGIFGILIGTLSQKYFRTVVSVVQTVIEQAGRSSYTFAMGKVNPAKVANFAEVECFVMVACAETSWLEEGEQREMHVPIITPLELHMALGAGGPEVQWGECDYSLNYNDFLCKYPSHDNGRSNNGHATDNLAEDGEEEDNDDKDAPYYSLISGKYEPARKTSDTDKEGLDLRALPGKGQLTSYKSEAAEFLKKREYRGLETKAGETEVHVAAPGLKGIASKYNND